MSAAGWRLATAAGWVAVGILTGRLVAASPSPGIPLAAALLLAFAGALLLQRASSEAAPVASPPLVVVLLIVTFTAMAAMVDPRTHAGIQHSMPDVAAMHGGHHGH
jgi:hypothetical protein